jgi:hypothetical protein
MVKAMAPTCPTWPPSTRRWRAHAQGHGARHRRAVPPRRGGSTRKSARCDARGLGAAHAALTACRDAELNIAPRRLAGRSRAVAMSLYHMYVATAIGAAGGADLPRHAPAVRAGAGLPAVPGGRSPPGPAPPGAGSTRRCSPVSAARWAHLRQLPDITNRIIYIDDLTLRTGLAVVAVLLVLDATRRVIGWALPITAMAFLAYALLHRHEAAGAAGAAVPVHRGHLRLHAGRVGQPT